MNHGSLFSGIGGFELAAQWMGWTNVFSVEFAPFCQTILEHHFPESEKHGDIYNFNGEPYRDRVDIITGGFPCQPFSAAGKRQGTSDERYLWPEMFRVIREVGPRWVVAENVRGLTHWNGGAVLDTVCVDLEGEGYEVFPTVLPASGVNAPHKRERIFVVGHLADANRKDLERGDEQGEAARSTNSSIGTKPPHRPTQWEAFPRFSPFCGGDDGFSAELDSMSFPQWRAKSVTAYGNAVCPPLVFQLFQAIEKSMG